MSIPVESWWGIAQLGQGTSFESRVITQLGNYLSIIISVFCGASGHFFGVIRPNGWFFGVRCLEWPNTPLSTERSVSEVHLATGSLK